MNVSFQFMSALGWERHGLNRLLVGAGLGSGLGEGLGGKRERTEHLLFWQYFKANVVLQRRLWPSHVDGRQDANLELAGPLVHAHLQSN